MPSHSPALVPPPSPASAVLLEDNEGAVAGQLLLETVVQGAQRLSAAARGKLQGWVWGPQPAA